MIFCDKTWRGNLIQRNIWIHWLWLLLAGLSVQAGNRQVLNLDPEWKFIRSDPPGAGNMDFNANSWTAVSLPHTYNDVDTFDNFSPGRMLGETNQWSGRTWYRKTFILPASFNRKDIFVEFEAIRQVAEVYLNGHLLGVSKNGFAPFGFDMTPFARFGQTNLLAVMCDNRFMTSQNERKLGTRHELGSSGASGSAGYQTMGESVAKIQADKIPWNDPTWHPPLGGIYRNVRLYVTDPLHIALPLYDFLQTEGPYVYATKISRESAAVTVEVPVQNGRDTGQSLTVQVEILNHDGHCVARWDRLVKVAAGAQTQVKLSGNLTHPELWEPDYPYLYHVVCSLRQGEATVDSTEVPLGIRAVDWDVNTGFWINGHHLKLHGWGQRPTDEWPGLGTAQPDWLHYFTLALMKQAGGNFLRWGHCAGGVSMIRAGDELGFVTDQPGVDGEADTTGAAWKIRAAAFRDTIIYYRNDPSILIWEGGNQKVTQAHAAELRHFVQEYDPHGGRVYAHRRADEITGRFMDVSIGTEGSHEVPRLPVVEGEYDREESPRRVWDTASPPEYGYPEARGQIYDLTSEQFAVNEVTQYVSKLGAPSHCGGANWIFSDSTSGGRDTAEVDRASGEVDAVRLPKQAYYVCQTMFRKDPQVHIIGHWTYPAGTKKTVYVTSNCQHVKLYVNGKEIGETNATERYLFMFPDVKWQAGEIEAVASNGGHPVITNIIRTAGPPVALRLTTITGPGGLQADGSDVALIDVEAVDAKGERCPTFQKQVHFTCAGPAVWRGGYDSGQANSINHNYLDLEAGINRVAIRSTLAAGDIVVGAFCPGLKPGSVTITSHGFLVTNGYSGTMPAMPVPPLPVNAPDWERLSKSTPPLTVNTTTVDQAMAGQFMRTFNYTGPTELVHVERGAADGKNIYCDRNYAFADLPPELAGADWVQAAQADKAYAAADLMQVAAKAGTTVLVAMDASVSAPKWLSSQFHATRLSFKVHGCAMRLFERHLTDGGSLTLGSNGGMAGSPGGAMYIVFVQDDEAILSDSR